MDAKEFFNSIANIASAFSSNAPAPRQARGAPKAKPLQFGGGAPSGGSTPPAAPTPSCCIAKRASQAPPVGPGKLPPVRKP